MEQTGGQIAWNLYGPGPDEILWRNQAGGSATASRDTDPRALLVFAKGERSRRRGL